MKAINIHTRIIPQSHKVVSDLLKTLASKNDAVWPYEQWPKMKFHDGLVEGAHGGHGIVRYSVEKYIPHRFIQFRFSKPVGFNGIHKLEITEVDNHNTEIKHTIDVKLEGIANLTWPLVIRPLHDALIEDAFDKVENQFLSVHKKSPWSLWVRFLRKMFGT